MGEWTEYPFGEVIDFKEGPGILAKDFRADGVPLIRLSGLEPGGSVVRGCDYLDPEMVQAKWAHFRVAEGDILLSSSATLGRTATVGSDAVGAIPYTGIIRMRPRDGRITSGFIRYLLAGPDFQRQAEVAGVGSVMRHFGPMHLRQMTVRIPSVTEQRRIVGILGALDDQIEASRQITDTLGSIASNVYRAFSSAASKDAAIGDVAQVIDCLHSKKPERRVTGKPLLQLNNIRDDGLLDMRDAYLIDEADYAFWISRIEATPGDCVITNVGRVGAVAQVPPGVRAALGRNMTAVRCRSDFPYPTFLLQALLSDAMRAEIGLNTDTGTILDALNVRSIPRLKLPLPSDSDLLRFEAMVRPIRARMEHALEESGVLAATRDTLMPRLLAGELTVST